MTVLKRIAAWFHVNQVAETTKQQSDTLADRLVRDAERDLEYAIRTELEPAQKEAQRNSKPSAKLALNVAEDRVADCRAVVDTCKQLRDGKTPAALDVA